MSLVHDRWCTNRKTKVMLIGVDYTDDSQDYRAVSSPACTQHVTQTPLCSLCTSLLLSFIAISAPLHRLRPSKQRTIHRIHNRLRRDRPPAKEASVQTLHRLLTTRDSIKFDVDIALSVRVERKMHDVTVFLLAFFADVVFELFDPVFAGFPTGWVLVC